MRSKRNLWGGAAAPVWITGVGAVSPAGSGVNAVLAALEARRTCLGPLTRNLDRCGDRWGASRLDPRSTGGQVEDRWLETWSGLRADDDRIVPLLALAMEAALADAQGPRGEIALLLGTALGAVGHLEAAPLPIGLEGDAPWSFERLRRRLEEALDACCPAEGGVRRAAGPAAVFSVTCVSGLCALEEAALRLGEGSATVALCGAADTMTGVMHRGFTSLSALSATGRLSPFDVAHDGIVISEAAAFMTLESGRAGLERGAPLRGAIVGQRLISDALHLTSPDEQGRGMARAIDGALRDAGVAPDEVGCVTVTAAGSAVYDRMQARALRAALGERALRQVPVTTWEPAIGHALAATGALGPVVATRILATGVVPPFFGLDLVDPECADLRLVTASPVPLASPCVLALTVGFGGQNGATVIAGKEMAADLTARWRAAA